MKKMFLAAFCILTLCSLLLIANVGTIMASNSAYSMIEYWAVTPATIDGNWTSPDEWTDAPPMDMGGNAKFKYKVDTSGGSGNYKMQWLIEIFDDNTTDALDVWQICLDPGNVGGSDPTSDHWRIDITGHASDALYQGGGGGLWFGQPPLGSEMTWADSISASPWNSTPHYILEVSILKDTGTIIVGAPPNAMRVAVYDASNPSAGYQAWPPGPATDRDVPDNWGYIPTYSDTPYPEDFSIVFVVLLSSAALAVSFYCLRKRSKTESYGSAKTGIKTTR